MMCSLEKIVKLWFNGLVKTIKSITKLISLFKKLNTMAS